MDSDEALDAALAVPTETLTDAVRQLTGDVAVLGASGKMGPTLVRLLLAADRMAGTHRAVYAVARFGNAAVAASLERLGATVIQADLVDPDQVTGLPAAANIIYMVGQKFGTTGDPPRTWALNTAVPALVAHRYRTSRIVVFSTGNVYPLWSVTSAGPAETDPTDPIGDYAQSALAREMVFRHYAARSATRLAILRLNYAIEPRYGVLRDLADKIVADIPIDLTTGFVNVIWQADANAIAIQALAQCGVPPLVLNLTGRPAVSVRDLATRLGRRLGKTPVFEGAEAATALLSDAKAVERLLGAPPTSVEMMIDAVAGWVLKGGRSLGKPTHFDERSGTF